jgi:hypothetical protein
LNQFDGFDGGLRILAGDIHEDDFGAQILNLAQNWVSGSGRKSDVTKNHPAQARTFHTAL